MDRKGGIYHLLGKVGHKNFQYGYSLLKEENLHPGQLPLLILLWKEEGLSQRELAHKMGIKPSTLNVTIGRLEKNGFIRKENDPKDQRKSLIYFTEEGKRTFRVLKKRMDCLQMQILDAFSEEEKIEFCRLLTKFCDCLDEQMQEIENGKG